jgi:uncharacterized membrane protein
MKLYNDLEITSDHDYFKEILTLEALLGVIQDPYYCKTLYDAIIIIKQTIEGCLKANEQTKTHP